MRPAPCVERTSCRRSGRRATCRGARRPGSATAAMLVRLSRTTPAATAAEGERHRGGILVADRARLASGTSVVASRWRPSTTYRQNARSASVKKTWVPAWPGNRPLQRRAAEHGRPQPVRHASAPEQRLAHALRAVLEQHDKHVAAAHQVDRAAAEVAALLGQGRSWRDARPDGSARAVSRCSMAIGRPRRP